MECQTLYISSYNLHHIINRLIQENMPPKYLIGTLFDEDQLDQKSNINTIKNKDPMGNTRWQGAFTGGFSAGYKNTCGSKEGWQPTQFVSSVSKRAQHQTQSIRDFLDKEDLGKESISSNIELNQNFTSKTKDPFNIAVETSIGERILNKIKKTKAMESVPENEEDLDKLLKYYEKQDIIEEHTQTAAYSFKDLEQPFSVGANQFNCENDEFIENYEELYRRVIRATVKEQTQEQKQKRLQENKIYFDFTKPIEQQPQYLRQIHEIEDLQRPKKRKKNLLSMLRLKDLFTSPIEFKEFKNESCIQKVPEDYDPYHRIRSLDNFLFPSKKAVPEEQAKPKHRIHSIQQRADILGSQKLSSKFRSATSNSFVKGDGKSQPEIKKHFKDDKKNSRYFDYVEELEGRKIASRNEYLSYEEAEKEREEFQAMYEAQKNRNLNASHSQGNDKTNQWKESKHKEENHLDKSQIERNQISRILAQKRQQADQVTITRTTAPWRPSQLLCKRFGCLIPYKVDDNSQKGGKEIYF